ncbi:hypothetical protein G6F59_018063 [Rhizopus arrhizus]|nr:hypothetical protein G6F59_018063 [Rhizopus arrhizus]
MARITGLQHDEQRRQRQQFAGNGLAGHPEPLVFAQAQPRQRIHDEAGGGRQQRPRQQARGLPRQLRVAPGQPAHAEQRADPLPGRRTGTAKKCPAWPADQLPRRAPGHPATACR